MIFLRRRLLNSFHTIGVALILAGAAFGQARAQNVILHLKSGDNISGFIVSEFTNRLVLSNSWVKNLSVPLAEVGQREIIIAATTNRPAGSNALAKIKAQAAPPVPPPLFKHWKGMAEVGLDLVYSTSDQRTYHGRFSLSYELPYVSNPKNFFRNTLDYHVEYGKTEQKINGVTQTTTSSDQMGVSDKTSMDFDRRWYAYNLAGAGFDRVRDIDLQIEEGPGLGYHLLTLPNLAVNLEGGANYQIQYNTDSTGKKTHTRDFFYRAAEDVNWKINTRTTLSEKAEFFPRVDFSQYRFRAEATLSYNLWRYVYMNMTVRDSYDTTAVAGAQPNELEVHSALGVKF
jgi:hypothetical protein